MNMSNLYANPRNLDGMSSQRYQKLETKLLNSIVDFWKKDVIPKLSDMTDPTDLSSTIVQINNRMYTELFKRVETHIKDILKLGLVDGSRRTQVPQSLVNETFNKIMQQSSIQEGIQRLTDRMGNKLLQIPNLTDTFGDKTLIQGMKNIAYRELQKYETVARTDSQFIVNQSRIIEWQRTDPKERRLYKWGRGYDSRTTDCCKEIEATVQQEANNYNGRGVPLSRLIEIVAFVGNKHFPDFNQRELNPHHNCRSGPEYAGLRRVD